MDISKKTNSGMNSTKKSVVVILSILLLAVIGYGLFQYTEIRRLNEEVSSLGGKVASNITKNSKLAAENLSLTKALKTLQQEITTGNNSEQNNEPSVVTPLSKLTVTAVDHQSITVPANEHHGPLSTDYFAVHATIKNQSDVNQFYSLDNFSVITEEGLIIKPHGFGPGIEQDVWTRSELAPNGQTNAVLLFASDKKLATLLLTIPGTTDQLSVVLPASS